MDIDVCLRTLVADREPLTVVITACMFVPLLVPMVEVVRVLGHRRLLLVGGLDEPREATTAVVVVEVSLHLPRDE